MLASLAPALGAGAVARLGGVDLGAAPARAQQHEHDHGATTTPQPHAHGPVSNHPGFQMGGRVNHVANGFDPTEVLRDFDHGTTRRLASGRTLREWELIATDKDVEVAPGVKFPAVGGAGFPSGDTFGAAVGGGAVGGGGSVAGGAQLTTEQNDTNPGEPPVP